MNKNKSKKRERMETMFEFLVFGVLMGIVEDLIAISLATDAEFNLSVLVIIIVVAIPFAVVGELIVDRKDIEFFQKWKKGDK